MENLLKSYGHPWIIGAFAVYTRSLGDAMKVYEWIKEDQSLVDPFGTISLESGEEVDWVNLKYIHRDVVHLDQIR